MGCGESWEQPAIDAGECPDDDPGHAFKELRAVYGAMKAERDRYRRALVGLLAMLDEFVRDGGGEYEEAAARRDAELIRRTLEGPTP